MLGLVLLLSKLVHSHFFEECLTLAQKEKATVQPLNVQHPLWDDGIWPVTYSRTPLSSQLSLYYIIIIY